MAFITFEKANSFLDENKLRFTGTEDLAPELERAENLIISRLQATYPTAISAWLTPATTPKLVQDVAGALCAAWRYSKVYSEEQISTSSFAVALETQAMDALDGVASGVYVLTDATEEPAVQITSDDFWPNDTVSDDTESDDYSPRRFTMNMEF